MKIGIAGAGIMGQLLAYEFSQAGYDVAVFDKEPSGSEANCSFAAAGLLTPITELEKCGGEIFQLGLKAINEYWPDILAQLEPEIYFQQRGSLVLAHPKDVTELLRFTGFVKNNLTTVDTPSPIENRKDELNAAEINLLDSSQILMLEPELNKWQSAYYFPQEGCLDNQALLITVTKYLQDRGVKLNFNSPVKKIKSAEIILANRTEKFDWVIDCRGLGAKTSFPEVRGVRGELIWVYAPQVNISRPIRLLHPRYSLYVVPRPNSIYILGASEIESADMSEISVRTTLELLSAAYSLHSGFAEARIIKTVTQCRPTLPNNLPGIKYGEKIIAVNGLYRHGFLIAPTLAKEVLRYIKNGIKSVGFPLFWKKY